MNTLSPELVQRITAIEAGQAELFRQMATVSAQQGHLADAFQASRRPQWQLFLGVIGIFVTVIGMTSAMLGSVALLVIASKTAPLEREVAINRDLAINAMPRKEYEQQHENLKSWVRLIYRQVNHEEMPVK